MRDGRDLFILFDLFPYNSEFMLFLANSEHLLMHFEILLEWLLSMCNGHLYLFFFVSNMLH